LSSTRRLLVWGFLALAACALLVAVLSWEHKHDRSRWSSVLVGNPQTGRQIFQQKGCIYCHNDDGTGAKTSTDATSVHSSPPGPDRIVTAMWNHTPEMWKRMQAERVAYPALSQEEMAHLFAYLYAARTVEQLGGADRGRELFEAKGCIGCHAAHGASGRPPALPALAGVDTPVRWARAMWNHPPATQDGADQPRFERGEMGDLVAYVRGGRATRFDVELLKADAGRGSKLFQERSCTVCHSVKDEAGRVGPELGPGRELPPTIVQLAGSMWNHAPAMRKAMAERDIKPATFNDEEMADLVAFLYSLRYIEPGGSPKLGEVLFAGRGCSRCHGSAAQGSPQGPGLRGRGKNFNSVTLAAALWRHGPGMYQRVQEMGLRWPVLIGSDVGDLMTFLNTPPEGKQ
jgi:mono/diheme cytochrome c family protein